MRKKHAASEVAHLTKCGYEITAHEYARMKHSRDWYVTCKRCLRLLK